MDTRISWVALSLSNQLVDVKERIRGAGPTLFESSVVPDCDVPGASRTEAERVIERAVELGVRVVTYPDDEYPDHLRDVALPPPVLYAVGDLALLKRPCVAIVGSRRCSAYGRWAARTLARGLSHAGVCVVSGMAFGVDAAAHEGALDGPGGTIAVLGGGPERPSPASLRPLYRSLAAGQLVVSEFPPGTSPKPAYFPRRNRVVAGLSRGVIVVEAAIRSGALITAREAMEAGREVFAVPGPIDSSTSAGTNRLLWEGATPALGATEVVEALGTAVDVDGGCPADRILEALAGGPMSVPELQERTGLAREHIAGQLLRLRLGGAVGAMPGQRFRRVE